MVVADQTMAAYYSARLPEPAVSYSLTMQPIDFAFRFPSQKFGKKSSAKQSFQVSYLVYKEWKWTHVSLLLLNYNHNILKLQVAV